MRWRIAWNGLLDARWVCYHRGVGHAKSPIIASYSAFHPNVNVTDQYNICMEYWADQLIRVNTDLPQRGVLDYFTLNIMHFRQVFSLINPKEIGGGRQIKFDKVLNRF